MLVIFDELINPDKLVTEVTVVELAVTLNT